MSWFWDYIEKENNRRLEERPYTDNPNQIAWISIGGGLLFFLFMFVFCPTMNKNAEKEYKEYEKSCQNSFYKYYLYGIVEGKYFKDHTEYMTVYTINLKTTEVIDCRCSRLHSIYDGVEVGDTILKSADTLLVKIYNSPKYEELNRYETFRKK
jgi:hypothetical protein